MLCVVLSGLVIVLFCLVSCLFVFRLASSCLVLYAYALSLSRPRERRKKKKVVSMCTVVRFSVGCRARDKG